MKESSVKKNSNCTHIRSNKIKQDTQYFIYCVHNCFIKYPHKLFHSILFLTLRRDSVGLQTFRLNLSSQKKYNAPNPQYNRIIQRVLPPLIAEYMVPNTQNATAAISADVMAKTKASGKMNQLRFMLIIVLFIRSHAEELTRALSPSDAVA